MSQLPNTQAILPPPPPPTARSGRIVMQKQRLSPFVLGKKVKELNYWPCNPNAPYFKCPVYKPSIMITIQVVNQSSRDRKSVV